MKKISPSALDFYQFIGIFAMKKVEIAKRNRVKNIVVGVLQKLTFFRNKSLLKRKSIYAKLGTLNYVWVELVVQRCGGKSTKCISEIKTWLTNIVQHRVTKIYQNWLEYIRTGSIFVISSRYMGLKWPSCQINELSVAKRVKNNFLGWIKFIGGCVRMYFAIITTGVLSSSLQDPIGPSVPNHPPKRGQKTPMKLTAPTRKL